MSQELHYTSVPRGLNPGSRGFCTVGCTPHMPGPLVERLESLSGYQPVYPVHDPAADQNPINFSHLKLTIRTNSVSVLSRVGPAELDYSGRSNKYAHHVVLEMSERPVGGPAWSLSQPGFLQETWEGEPRVLSAGRTPKPGDRPGGVAIAWKALTGDPGWAGVLAESFLVDSKRAAFLIFQPGMDLLPLFVEAMALLPPHRRWDVEFSTYFTTLPQGVTCHWRGVLEGSPEADHALRLPNTLVINLSNPDRRAEGHALVRQARGERPESPVVDAGTSPPYSLSKGAASGVERPQIPMNPSRGIPPCPPTHYERYLDLAASAPNHGSRRSDRPSRTQGHKGQTLALVAGICVVCVVVTAGVGTYLFWPQYEPKKNPALVVANGDVKKATAQDPGAKPPEEPQPRERTPILAQGGAEGQPTAPSKKENPSSSERAPEKVEIPSQAASTQAKAEIPSQTEPGHAKAEKPFQSGIVVSAGQPQTHIPQPKSKMAEKDVTLLFFDLPEPKSNLSILNLSTTPGIPTLDLPRSGASQLELIDLPKGTNTKKANSGSEGRQVANGESDGTNGKEHALARFMLKGGKVNFELNARQVAKGGLDVMIGASNGTDNKEHALAHFILKERKVNFEWDNDPWSSGNNEFRDQLRNRVLKIRMGDGEMRYSLLRKRPDTIAGPARIRPISISGRRNPENSDPFASFISVKNKRERFTFIKWLDARQEKEYSYLENNIIILNIESTLPSSNAKKFLKKGGENDGWSCDGNSELFFKFANQRNQIQFTFDGSVSIPSDTTVIDQILDAPYKVVLGLRVDDGQIVEMVRIGSLTPPKTDVTPPKTEVRF